MKEAITVVDNVDTKKEGTAPTYDRPYGFAPIFAHLGGGFMAGARLRPGNAHSYTSGTKEFIADSIRKAKSLVADPVLLVADGGFDSQDLIRFLLDQQTDFIIKHNRRQESKTGRLQAAKAHGHVVRPIEIRYAWPSELNLMTRLAGLHLVHRWSGWDGREFGCPRGCRFRSSISPALNEALVRRLTCAASGCRRRLGASTESGEASPQMRRTLGGV